MEHDDARKLLATYVAGGLEGPELAELEAHVASCERCAAELRELTQLDEEMEMIFAGARPEANLEDRIVRGLWMGGHSLKMPTMRVHPAVWKVAMGVAATVMLGTIGYVGNGLITNNRLPLMGGEIATVYDVEDLGEQRPEFSAPADFDLGQPATRPSERDYSRMSRDKELGAWSRRQASPDEAGRERVEKLSGKLAQDGRGKYAERTPAPAGALRGGDGERGGGGAAGAGGRQLAGERSQHWGFRGAVPQSGSGTLAFGVADNDGDGKGDEAKAYFQNGQVAFGESFDASYMTTTATRQMDLAGNKAGYADVSGLYTSFQPPAGAAPKPDAAAGKDNKDALETNATGLGSAERFKPATYGFALSESAEGDKQKMGGAPVEGQSMVTLGMDKAQSQRAGAQVSKTLAGAQPSRPSEPDAPKASEGGPAEKIPYMDVLKYPENWPDVAIAQNSQPVVQPQNPPAVNQFARKIIRNGEMEFEVDSFDSSFVTISRVVGEEGGFVSSTNSEKLPNGKVRGTVVVRVPPDRLDTLVLKLRALGDIKSQKISAQDVTKVYYDLESELKAARAMEERLLNIIKSGKGEIKDLLEAEKQLGVYREKIEKLEGEVRYYNNLVSLSTLSITASERDIRQAAMTAQSETVSMGLESEDVEKSRADALKAIEDAKGRIIESNLKKYDAGQVAATVVAEINPDAAGPLIDRLRQLGKVARLDIDRRQTTPEGRPPVPGARVERKDTRFAISIYNLANIAPRQTTNLNLAVPNVEDAYRAILAAVTQHKGRVVTSNLARQKGGEQTTATIQFEVPSPEADAALTALRLEREVMALTVTENPDTQNVTTAKRGFSVQIYSLATVPPRETEQIVLASRGRVGDTFRNLLAEARKVDARVLISQLNEQDASNLGASLDIEVLRGKEIDLRQALLNAGDIVSRNVNRSSDTDNTVDSKVRLQLRLIGLEKLAPRETQALSVAAYDVPASYSALVAALSESGARVISSQLNEQDRTNITATLDFEVLRANREKVDKALSDAGVVYARSVTRSPDTQNTVDNKVRLQVVMANVSQLPPRESAQISVVVKDVGGAVRQVVTNATAVGGRVIESRQATDNRGRNTSQVILDVPLAKAGEMRSAIENLGEVRVNEASTNPATPDGQVARARFEVTLANAELIVGRDQGLGASLRNAISTSVKGLLWSLQFIVVGLLFVGPWALLIWVLWRFIRKPRPAVATVPTT